MDKWYSIKRNAFQPKTIFSTQKWNPYVIIGGVFNFLLCYLEQQKRIITWVHYFITIHTEQCQRNYTILFFFIFNTLHYLSYSLSWIFEFFPFKCLLWWKCLFCPSSTAKCKMKWRAEKNIAYRTKWQIFPNISMLNQCLWRYFFFFSSLLFFLFDMHTFEFQMHSNIQPNLLVVSCVNQWINGNELTKLNEKSAKLLTKLFFPSVFEFHKSNRKLFTGITYIL